MLQAVPVLLGLTSLQGYRKKGSAISLSVMFWVLMISGRTLRSVSFAMSFIQTACGNILSVTRIRLKQSFIWALFLRRQNMTLIWLLIRILYFLAIFGNGVRIMTCVLFMLLLPLHMAMARMALLMMKIQTILQNYSR